MSSPEEIRELLQKFQQTLENWPRDGGLFLDLMKEKLNQIQRGFANDIATQLPAEAMSNHAGIAKMAAGEKEVYVALYQADGENIDKWGITLNSISMQGISRPIYENEADACSMIRSKDQKNKEAYAVVKIRSSDIVSSPQPHLDRAGRGLMYVKPGSFKPENILRFVHLSGQYLWQQGRLIKLDLSSPI